MFTQNNCTDFVKYAVQFEHGKGTFHSSNILQALFDKQYISWITRNLYTKATSLRSVAHKHMQKGMRSQTKPN